MYIYIHKYIRTKHLLYIQYINIHICSVCIYIYIHIHIIDVVLSPNDFGLTPKTQNH